jgi:hypothetical protein
MTKGKAIGHIILSVYGEDEKVFPLSDLMHGEVVLETIIEPDKADALLKRLNLLKMMREGGMPLSSLEMGLPTIPAFFSRESRPFFRRPTIHVEEDGIYWTAVLPTQDRFIRTQKVWSEKLTLKELLRLLNKGKKSHRKGLAA